jgi:hypothetical protein
MNFKIKKYLTFNRILLLIAMLIAVFFRFYNTPNRYGFDIDPTRDGLIVDYAAKTLQFPLIGPPSGIGPFTFGPWYYYQLIVFKIIFPFLNFAPWIYIGILSTIAVFIMYKIGVLLQGKKLGLLLMVLFALTPAETGQIRALSNPTLIPLYGVLAIWIFIKFVKEKPPLWMSFLWGLVLGIGINNHYQMLGLLPLPIIIFFYKKEKRWTGILSFIAGLFISFLPLFIYNFIHGWSTVKGLIFYATQGTKGVYIPNRWLSYVTDFWPVFLAYVLGIPAKAGLYVGLVIGLVIGYLTLRRKISIPSIFLVITFSINFLVLRFFPGQREYYYLLYLHPLILILFGLVILWLFNFKLGKCLGGLIVLLVLYGMLVQSVDRLGSASDQLQFKNEAKIIAGNFPGKKFVFYECKNSQKNRVRGVVFFLNMHNLLSEKGVKIAYPAEGCRFPLNKNAEPKYLNNLKAVDISYAQNGLLLKYGWSMVTPKTVYEQLFKLNDK